MSKRLTRIKNLGDVITGNTPPTEQEDFYGDKYLFIKATDIDEKLKYTFQTEDMYSEIAYKKYIKSLVPAKSICVVTIGSVGKKMTMAHVPLFVNQAINAVIPYSIEEADYIYYVVKANLSRLKTIDSGTTSGRENISKSSFSNMQLAIHEDYDERIKIGKLLSELDDLICLNRKQISNFEKLLKLKYEHVFLTNKVDVFDEDHRLGEFVNRRNDSLKEWDGLDLIDLSRMTPFSISVNDLGDASELNTNVKMVKEYDLLFGSIRPYQGKVGFSPINGAIAGSVFNFYPKNDFMYSYLLMLISSNDFINFAINYSNGTKMPVVDYDDDLMRYRLKVAKDVNVYKEFDSFCRPIIKNIFYLLHQNYSLEDYKSKLINRFFAYDFSLRGKEMV